jgi:hypothetical protein
LGFAFVFLNLLTQLDSSTRLPLLLFDLAILVGKPFRVWQNVLAWSLIESFFFFRFFSGTKSSCLRITCFDPVLDSLARCPAT